MGARPGMPPGMMAPGMMQGGPPPGTNNINVFSNALTNLSYFH